MQLHLFKFVCHKLKFKVLDVQRAYIHRHVATACRRSYTEEVASAEDQPVTMSANDASQQLHHARSNSGSSLLMSRKSSSSVAWQFDERYHAKHRELKRAAHDSKLLAYLLHPEPRYLMAGCLFLATLTAYVERTGFSIAYTLMASEAAGVSESTKGAVMSAFYWGYGLSQVPGGIAAQRYGGDTVLTFCFMSWSLASLMTPGDARRTFLLIFWRFVVGVSQGFLIPAVHTVVSVWMRREERAKAVSLITSGMYLGSASAMWLLPSVSRLFGGRAILRLVGVMGLCWVGLFRAVKRLFSTEISGAADRGTDRGTDRGGEGGGGGDLHRAVSSADGDSLPLVSSGASASRKRTPVEFLKHPSVQAIVVNNFTFHYAFYIVMNWLPTYFDSVLHAPLQSVGVAKTLPYLTMFFTSNAGAWLGDYVIKERGASVAAGRKLVNSCGFLAAAFMLCLMPAASDVTFGLLVTTLALGAAGFARGGFSVNHMDIAPGHAGVIMGISNTAGTIAGVIGVAVTGNILSSWGPDSKGGWYVSFMLAAALCVVGTVVFARYAQGRRVFS